MPVIQLVAGIHKLAGRVGKDINEVLKKNTERPVLVLVSGGSSLSVLEHVDPALFGENDAVSLIDERFSRLPEESNFLQLTTTTFFAEASARGATFISPLPEEGETLESAAARWERTMHDWVLAHNPLVIALLGIGADGHTAGIMPFPEDAHAFANLFEKKDSWIVGYDAGDMNRFPHRMTFTISFLRNMVDYAFVYVSGALKKSILKKVLTSETAAVLPASIIHSIKRVVVYTDITLEN